MKRYLLGILFSFTGIIYAQDNHHGVDVHQNSLKQKD